MNEKLERIKRDRWLDKLDQISMEIERLVAIAIQGHEYCPEDEYCLSRNYSGVAACMCIRSIFATPEHYELYLCLRQLLLETELLENIEGEKNENSKANKSIRNSEKI